jgi:hypothetical protein
LGARGLSAGQEQRERGVAMGAEPYQYLVPYQQDIQGALVSLRATVFASGEYNGAQLGPATPEEAFEMAEEDGTGSILDIAQISNRPDFCCAAPFSAVELEHYFGTDKPTLEEAQESDGYWEDIGRGQARYFVIYENGQPSQICFAGYSFD